MALHQRKAAEFGCPREGGVAIDPVRQRGQDGASIRRHPAFALATGGTWLRLPDPAPEWLAALEARAFRRGRGFHHPAISDDARRHLAAPPRLLLFDRLRR
jgi:hypothetical protein